MILFNIFEPKYIDMQYVTIVTLSLIQSHVNDDKIILTLITITHPVTFKTKKDNK